MKNDLGASIQARLNNLAKERGQVFQDVLTRYGIERFLYRLSTTPARETLWLKGALLFDLWFDAPHRSTRDADFLGFGPPDQAVLEKAVREACSVEVPDGMEYDAASMHIREIREGARYPGLRVNLTGNLKRARCPVQLDIGFGDAVTPGPVEAILPTLLDDLPAPRLLVYPRETVIAEKLEAIATLGMANSRMKDYFDLGALAREGGTTEGVLTEAIRATFQRRRTPLPPELPLGLSDTFALDTSKQVQWSAFLARNRLEAPPLDVVVTDIRTFIAVPLRLASRQGEST